MSLTNRVKTKQICSLAQPISQTAFNNSKCNSVFDLGLDQILIFRVGGLKYSYDDQYHETSKVKSK